MRRATMGSAWVMKGTQVMIFFLGVDATAEHEMGIGPMQDELGVDTRPTAGFDDRIIRHLPEAFGSEVLEDGNLLLSTDLARAKARVKDELFFTDQPRSTVTAWDGRNFAIRSKDEDIEKLEQLEQAMREGRVMFWGLRTTPTKGAGLALAMVDAIPDDLRAQVDAAAQSAVRLAAAVAKLDIESKLRAANRQYFALVPRWKDAEESEVVFLLNPREQNKYNYGWYSVADLLQWIEGKGPIVRAEAA